LWLGKNSLNHSNGNGVTTPKSERNLRGNLAPFEVAIYTSEIAGLSRYHYYPPTTIDPGKWSVKRQLLVNNHSYEKSI